MNRLFVFYCAVVFNGILFSGAQAPPGDCLIDGIVRRHGERFELRCSGMCHCENGAVGCVSMCPPFGMPPECRTLKKLGDCCRLPQCPNEVERSRCETDMEFSAPPAEVEPPWVVRMAVENGPQKGHCVAAMMNRTLIFASPDCASTTTQFTNPPSVSNISIGPISDGSNPNRPQITKFEVPGEEHHEKVVFTRKTHEINTPYKQVCNRSDCALIIGAFDPTTDKFHLIRANQADLIRCDINPEDQARGIRCLEITSQDYPACTNMAGGVVTVKAGDHFFLKGFVVDSPFSQKGVNGCDEKKQKFKRLYDFCSELSETVVIAR